MIIKETTLPLSYYRGMTTILVNPVNLVGVQGAGVAKWFKQTYPKTDLEYRQACPHFFREGQVLVFRGQKSHLAYVPTKHHWKDKSTEELLENSLWALEQYLTPHNDLTIVTTRLGCGLGGLSWDYVRSVLDRMYAQVIVATGPLTFEGVYDEEWTPIIYGRPLHGSFS